MPALLSLFARTWLALASAPLVATPAAATAAAAAAPAPAASDAAAIVDKVQQFYAGIKQVSALFRQTVTNSTFGSSKTSDGKVWIEKPGKMRWDYYETEHGKVMVTKSFISNGTYLYVIEHDNKQVVKKNLQHDLMPVAVSFLYGTGDLNAEFNARLDTSGTYGAKSDIVLALTPKQPSAQYKELILVVSPKDYHVTQSVIIDSSNNTNHFQFYSPDFKTPVDNNWFQFNPASVPNYRVIDADQQKS